VRLAIDSRGLWIPSKISPIIPFNQIKIKSTSKRLQTRPKLHRQRLLLPDDRISHGKATGVFVHYMVRMCVELSDFFVYGDLGWRLCRHPIE